MYRLIPTRFANRCFKIPNTEHTENYVDATKELRHTSCASNKLRALNAALAKLFDIIDYAEIIFDFRIYEEGRSLEDGDEPTYQISKRYDILSIVYLYAYIMHRNEIVKNLCEYQDAYGANWYCSIIYEECINIRYKDGRFKTMTFEKFADKYNLKKYFKVQSIM